MTAGERLAPPRLNWRLILAITINNALWIGFVLVMPRA